MSECTPPSHHPLKHNARTRISNSHVSYHIIAVEIGRATEQPRKHPSHLQTIPKSLSMSITIASISRPNSSQTQRSSSRGLSVSRSDRSMSMRPGLITGLRNIKKANDPYAVRRNARGKGETIENQVPRKPCTVRGKYRKIVRVMKTDERREITAAVCATRRKIGLSRFAYSRLWLPCIHSSICCSATFVTLRHGVWCLVSGLSAPRLSTVRLR
jgi:hypothetical protein